MRLTYGEIARSINSGLAASKLHIGVYLISYISSIVLLVIVLGALCENVAFSNPVHHKIVHDFNRITDQKT